MIKISTSYVTGLEKYINELRNQVSSLKAELREICAAIDDPACDLTLTTVECIKKLKEENESLKRDAERYRWLRNSEVGPSQIWELLSDDCQPPYMTLKAMHDLDAAIDAAMAQGEKP